MRKTLKILLVALLPFCVEAVSVALGGQHSCALLSNGRVMCWGRNNYGQLGDESVDDRTTPVEVSGLTKVKSIALGNDHSCALLRNGKVMCWGYNNMGKLGDGTTSARIFPVEVLGMSNAKSIAVGASHSCALLTDGKVMCWGSNYYSTLGTKWLIKTDKGDKHFHWSTSPVEVSGLTNVKSIALGGSHSCALMTDGKVMCWGNNGNGQLGNRGSYSETPLEVSGLTNAKSIALGASHSCALLTDGKVMCWGNPSSFDYDSEDPIRTPRKVTGISNVQSLSLGFAHSCALLTDGRVMCWGDGGRRGGSGTLGVIGSSNRPSTPLEVTGIATATGIAVGAYHSCALLTDGKVMCWGQNNYGQIGDKTTDNKILRVEVLGLTLAKSPRPTSRPTHLGYSALSTIVLSSIIMSFLYLLSLLLRQLYPRDKFRGSMPV